MELLVLMGLVAIIYCGYETLSESISPIRMCSKNLRSSSHVISATMKRLMHDFLKHLHHPHYRPTSTYCVHTHRMHVSHAKHPH